VRDVDEDEVLGDQVVHGVAKLDVGGAVARQLLHQAAGLAGGRGRAADCLQVEVVVAAFQLVGLDRDAEQARIRQNLGLAEQHAVLADFRGLQRGAEQARPRLGHRRAVGQRLGVGGHGEATDGGRCAPATAHGSMVYGR
jgi:hypothetical protein